MRHRLKEATFMMYINNRRFEWDDKKSAINFLKHKIAFKDALSAFDDPMGCFMEDEKHSFLERRQILIADASSGIILIAFTMRDNVIRIISARKANRRERRDYESQSR